MKTHITFIIMIIFITLIKVAPVHAQSVGLSISPPVVEILLAPNKQVVQTFRIKNLGEAVTLVPTLHALKPVGEHGQVALEPYPLSPATIPLIVTLAPSKLGDPLELSAHEALSLSLTLEGASVDISTDTYFALVLTPQVSPGSTATASLPAISALVLTTLTPTGIMPAQLEIAHFDPPLYHDSLTTLTLAPTLTNHAPIMIRPLGNFTVISPSGQTIFEEKFYPDLFLKDSTRVISGGGKADPPAPIPLSWTPTWHNLGPHRLRLSVTTQGGTKLTEIERVVWFLPIRALALGLILSLIILALLTYKKRISPLT